MSKYSIESKYGSDYISKQDAINKLYYEYRYGADIDRCGLSTAMDVIDEIEAAHVEPVAYGRWVYVDDDDMLYDTYYCSECRNRITVDSHRRDDIGFAIDDMKRCNKCGARMDGGEEHG